MSGLVGVSYQGVFCSAVSTLGTHVHGPEAGTSKLYRRNRSTAAQHHENGLVLLCRRDAHRYQALRLVSNHRLSWLPR